MLRLNRSKDWKSKKYLSKPYRGSKLEVLNLSEGNRSGYCL
jgi:hypothetical protein